MKKMEEMLIISMTFINIILTLINVYKGTGRKEEGHGRIVLVIFFTFFSKDEEEAFYAYQPPVHIYTSLSPLRASVSQSPFNNFAEFLACQRYELIHPGVYTLSCKNRRDAEIQLTRLRNNLPTNGFNGTIQVLKIREREFLEGVSLR